MAQVPQQLRQTGRHTGSLLVETAREWLADRATTYAGDLSYRIVLALSPLVVIAAGVVGLIYEDTDMLDDLVVRAGELLGEASADALQLVLTNMTRPGASLLAIVLGGLILLYTAGGAFRALRKSLNAIWNVEPTPLRPDARRLATFALNQLLMLGLVLVLALLLAGLLALSAGWSWLTEWASSSLPASSLVRRVGELGFTLVITTAVFAGLFSSVPQGRLPQRYIWLSALITAVLFSIGRLGFGVYISYSSKASAYGAAGTLIVFLIWVYYSSMIVFFGAEFAQVFARRRGIHVRPGRGARMGDGCMGLRAQQDSPQRGAEGEARDGDDAEAKAGSDSNSQGARAHGEADADAAEER